MAPVVNSTGRSSALFQRRDALQPYLSAAFCFALVILHNALQDLEIRSGCYEAATQTRRETRVSAPHGREMLRKWRVADGITKSNN